MKLSEIGEFGLIGRIRSMLPAQAQDVIVGIGDDVAVLAQPNDPTTVWLVTCDVQVEGSHFMRDRVDPEMLGRKAIAINQSDIAASGGAPRFAIVSLGLPDDLEVEFVDRLYQGLSAQAGQFGTEIIGGNISESKLGIFVDITLIGQAKRDEVVLRSGARPGDRILVTGRLGDAAAGVALIYRKVTAPDDYAAVARLVLEQPTPRVREGLIIGKSHSATAMLDISDGLAGDLQHILDASNVSARIECSKLPVAHDNRSLAQNVYGDEWQWALFGGEDYELVFTAPPDKAAELARAITDETGTQVSIIGEISGPPVRQELVLPDGNTVRLKPSGWDHFKS